MGKIRQGILGGFSGGVGNVVGGSWKGIDYMRILPASVSNPQTEGQMDQRMKFAVTIEFLKPLSQFLKIGFKNYAVKMTGMNAAFAYNFRHAIQGTYPGYTINYADALVAHGSLAPALNPVASSVAPVTVHFKWDNNSDELYASPLDKTLLVVFNPDKNQAVYSSELSDRATGSQDVTVPDSFSGDQVQCYMAFISIDGQVLSDSRYAGVVTVLPPL